MSSRTRAVGLLGMVGGALSLLQCTELTKVDWSAIPPASSGGASSGEAGMSASAGRTEAGASGEGGFAGEAGIAGEAGAGVGEGAFGGTFGGGGSGGGGAGGGGNGGTGGTAGLGGDVGTGGTVAAVHKTCITAPTQGIAGAANLASTLASSLIFFNGGAGGDGNRGGRMGLDQACATAKTALGLPHQSSHAVVTVTGYDAIFHAGNDDIFDMPENYNIPRTGVPIVSPLGIPLAASWNELWNVGVSPSLVCTGVMPVSSRTWLSGSSKTKFLPPGGDVAKDSEYGFLDYSVDSGNVVFNNACHGWSSNVNDDTNQARVGSTIADNDALLNDNPRLFYYRLDSCSAADGNVLCIAYDPVSP